jgi:hypothetical protein
MKFIMLSPALWPAEDYYKASGLMDIGRNKQARGLIIVVTCQRQGDCGETVN